MKTIILPVIVLVIGSLTVSAMITEEEKRIDAILVDVQMASNFSGKARVTANHDMLLRHAVTFKISEEKQETYLIHSPVRLFGAKPEIGREYVISRVFKPDTKTWMLEVHLPTQTKGVNQ